MPLSAPHVCNFKTNVFEDYYLSKKKLAWLKLILIYDHHPKVTVYMRSSAGLDFEKRRQIMSEWWYVIHPFSLLRSIWEAIMIIVYLMEELDAPFFLAWRINLFFMFSSDILKMVCFINIIATFFTGYLDENREIVLDLRQVAKHYLRGNFAWEFIAAFPWTSLFVHEVITNKILLENRALHVLSCTTFFTLVYIKSMLIYSSNLLMYLRVTFRLYYIYRLALISILFFHWLTCLQCYELYLLFHEEKSNLTKANQNSDLTIFETYCDCLFRTTTLVTKMGYGHQTSYLASDIITDIICLTCAVVFFYFCVEQIMLINTKRECPETKYQIQLRLLDGYMRQREMPQYMQQRLRLYYEYRFQKKFFRESLILSTLSFRLKQEILMHSCRRLVQESLLFRNVPRSIISFIINCLKHDIYLPNEIVIKAGSYGDCMFFLACGTVAVISRTGNEIAHMEDGSFFGELALVMEDERRVTSVLSIEFCEVYRLERQDFQNIVRPYGDLYNEIRRMAVDRLRQTLALEAAYASYKRMASIARKTGQER